MTTAGIRIDWNSDGKCRLTSADRATLAEGHDPGNDGSGRAFELEHATGYLYLKTPTDFEPILLGRIRQATADEIDAEDPGVKFRRLEDELAAANETIDRLMVQRDAALTSARANEAHLASLGDPHGAES
jgi:hypothetical protein